jgi:hypothetical protein
MKTKEKILSALEADGPLSSQEIARNLNIPLAHARACICYCKNKLNKVYIHSYRRDEEFGTLYPRALYAVGNRRDSVRPEPLPTAVYRKRYLSKKRAVGSNSVFGLSVPVEKRRLTTRRRPDVVERFTKERFPCSEKYTGVQNHNGRFQAVIKIKGKKTYLGAFDRAEEARDAYLIAKKAREKNADTI